jgi:hypothetical protein
MPRLGLLCLFVVIGNWGLYISGREGYTLGTSLIVTAILLPVGLGLIAWGRRPRRGQIRVADPNRLAVTNRMDQIAADGWNWELMAEEKREDAASLRYPLRGTADIVEELLPLVGNDVAEVMEALEGWHESRVREYERTGDEERAGLVRGLYMAVGINGIGNLFGFIPDKHRRSIRNSPPKGARGDGANDREWKLRAGCS